MDEHTQNDPHKYEVNVSEACFILNITSTSGLWQGDNPLTDSLPSLLVQLAFIIFINNSLFILLKPLHQPRFVTDILVGVLIGPSFLGKTKFFSHFFPLKTVTTLETVGYLSLDLYIFLMALEMDVYSLRRATRREFKIACGAVLLPMGMGIGLFFLAQRLLNFHTEPTGCLFWGLALTVTGFPVVSNILKNLKLLDSGIGKMAKSVAKMNDVCSWILVAIVLPIRLSPENSQSPITSTLAFILLCIYVIRPALRWIIRRTFTGNSDLHSDYYFCFALIGVVICSFITEICGTYSIIGAFVFGIIMPNRELASVLIEKFDVFVSGVLLPLFFAISGRRFNLYNVHHWHIVCLIVVMTCFCKIFSTVLISLLFNVPTEKIWPLGILMNTKGILALVILNLGWDKKVLSEEEYVVIMLAIVIMTGMVEPVLASIYKPSRRQKQFQRRTIQRAKIGAELRVLACLHSVNNTSGIINLLDISNATKQSPIYVFAPYLVDAPARSSALVVVHDTLKNGGYTHEHIDDSSSDQIINMLENFESQHAAISVQTLTVLSPLKTMHDVVCGLADDKNIAFMILPFHRQFGYNIPMENNSQSFREVNSNVLNNAPCSVGIFVHREVPVATIDDTKHRIQRLVMVFIGGPDDREALAYAWRMSASKHAIKLAVVRLHPGTSTKETEYSPDIQNQTQLDTEFINEFRARTEGEPRVNYKEKMVKNAEETITVLRGMDHGKIDLYIVGRQVIETSITAGMLEWSKCPEIGAIGDMLVFSDFARSSVLVVQQYAGVARDDNMVSIHGWNSQVTDNQV
ncbi:hypothetical protein Pint_10017 [Pistacia integerrima]|uniref:Uncharacterized protein n=1 Tax=Pistacia integerrima TaxID=434235 RepID=A0ACC0XI74_9ROSI|nr:hypothetical protein Pint_10017 [Pistacia integerrima]